MEHLLVVARESASADSLASYLSSNGYRTEIALTDGSIFTKMEQYWFSTVLVLIQGLNTKAVVDIITRIHNTAQIIAVDTNPKTFSIIESIQAGADDYVALEEFEDPSDIQKVVDIVRYTFQKIQRWRAVAGSISQRS